MRFVDFKRILSARLDKESVKIRKESESAKMSKTQKILLILSYFAKQRRKKSTKSKQHKQETDSWRPTCSTSASQSTASQSNFQKCCSAKEQAFRYLNENLFKIFTVGIFRKSQKPLL